MTSARKRQLRGHQGAAFGGGGRFAFGVGSEMGPAGPAGESETYADDALGDQLTYTDRDGTTHDYAYDALGRLTSDTVAAFGDGVGQRKGVGTKKRGRESMIPIGPAGRGTGLSIRGVPTVGRRRLLAWAGPAGR